MQMSKDENPRAVLEIWTNDITTYEAPDTNIPIDTEEQRRKSKNKIRVVTKARSSASLGDPLFFLIFYKRADASVEGQI